MKLYYTHGTCALAGHMALRELGATFELDRVDHGSKRTASGEDFLQVNPNGYVGALRLDSGEVLTEGPAILLYLAERSPGPLAPPTDPVARARLYSLLFFLSAELHQSFRPLFYPSDSVSERESAAQRLFARIGHLESTLADGRDYLLGPSLSIADLYAFVQLGWLGHFDLDLQRWPRLEALTRRVAALESVRRTRAVEAESEAAQSAA